MRSVLILLAGLSVACLHPPRTYKGSLEESSQQAIVFYEDGREDLILKVDYKMETEGALPTSLAWVVPVPNAPDKYHVESGVVFRELFKLLEKSNPSRSHGEDWGEPDTAGSKKQLKFLKKVSVGEYEIQPIQGKGRDAGPALNKWLTKNEFGEVPEENMAYYLKKGWTFLAIKILPLKAEKSLKKSGEFRPLRISFKADRIYYPLKFSSHQGTFDVTLYIVTRDGLARDRRGWPSPELMARLKKFGFKHAFLSAKMDSEDADFTATYPKLNELWKSIRKEGRITFKKATVNKLVALKVNNDGNPLSGWDEDFSISLK